MHTTTTISICILVFPIALQNMMQALTSRLEFRLKAYAWTEDDQNKITELKAHWIMVCVPVTMGNYL